MDDATRMALAQALMAQGDNPMADYMGQQGKYYRDSAGFNLPVGATSFLTGLGTTALGAPGIGIMGMLNGLNMGRMGMNDLRRANRAEQGAQMWGNTGMPARPTGEY